MPRKLTTKTQKQLIAENEDLRVRLDEAEDTLNAIRAGEVDALIVSGEGGEQVLMLKQVEESLHLSEEKYRTLVDEVNDGFYAMDMAGIFTFANPALARIFGVESPQALVGQKLSDFIAPERLAELSATYHLAMQTGDIAEVIDIPIIRPDGRRVFIEVKATSIAKGDQVVGTRGIVRDITENMRAEENLRLSEEKYRTLVDEVNDGFYEVDETGSFTFANPAMARIYGFESPQALVGRKFIDFIAPEVLAKLSQVQRSNMHTETVPEVIIGKIVRPDGTRAYLEIKPVSITEEDQIVGSRGVVRDITERTHAEDELRESEEAYRNLFENSVVGISQALPNGDLIRANNAYAQMYGYAKPQDILADVTNVERLYADREDWEEVLRILAARGVMEPREIAVVRRDGTRFFVLVSAREIRDSEGNLRYYQAEQVDITARKQSEERIQRQLEHLTALNGIDRIISANFNLKLSLLEILNHVKKELGVDAADILILNPSINMLEYGAERGFRTKDFRNVQLRLGESFAGRAALERKLIQIPNLKEQSHNHFLTTLLAGEDFVCYFGVPLVIKGQVKGVLEIFHRAALEPDAEWFDFLDALAGQTAIAIEIATLFESQQRSNTDLFLAYDATIEGWSQALDLRDKETEGHSQRVTEMTEELARLFGLNEAEIIQVRWGALLHDIGKMGVPDGILLKPGPLTDEEWVAMKKHPAFAYELLSPIGYLRLALDIPYCHHEKWDGSGYPRGLKGTQIPLVARIFAVVDVWDALKSDRPYRPAWTEEEVRKHIRTLSGTHFDPQVVDLFMKIHK